MKLKTELCGPDLNQGAPRLLGSTISARPLANGRERGTNVFFFVALSALGVALIVCSGMRAYPPQTASKPRSGGWVKTGGRLVKHARYYWLLLAEGHLSRGLFGSILRMIVALPLPDSWEAGERKLSLFRGGQGG